MGQGGYLNALKNMEQMEIEENPVLIEGLTISTHNFRQQEVSKLNENISMHTIHSTRTIFINFAHSIIAAKKLTKRAIVLARDYLREQSAEHNRRMQIHDERYKSNPYCIR